MSTNRATTISTCMLEPNPSVTLTRLDYREPHRNNGGHRADNSAYGGDVESVNRNHNRVRQSDA